MLLNNLFNYIFLFNYLILFTIIKSDSTTSTNLLNTINTPYDLNTISPYDVVYNIIYSYIENQKCSSNDIKYPQIIISDKCLSKLKNGDPTAKIVIGKIFIKLAPNINANNDISDIVGYKFYLETNAGLQYINIGSLCGGDIITYYLPLYPDDDSLETKYQNVIIQNPDSDDEDSFLDYDIFNPDADIYNDICTTITFSVASENVGNADTSFTNYDITLHERRKYYYPGSMALCPTGFTYKGIDKENFLSKCQTTINSEISSGIMSDGGLHPHTFNIFSAKSDFKKGKKDIYFSMDVFKCIKLPFTYRGFKNNYGSYCYFILLLAGKYHLLSVLEFIYNSNIKSMNYLKQTNMYNNINNNNQVIPYDVRSNNNLASSHQTLTSNGQLLSNILVGNNYLYNPNTEKISVSKNNNNKKDKKGKEKMMSNVDELENDFESEKGNEDKEKDKTIIQNINNKDVNILNVKDKNKNKKNDESNKSDNKKEKNNKSNPPKKKVENGDDNNEEENGKKEKKRKSIEISLNVKDLRDMMFKNQKQQSESIKVPEKKEEDKKSRTKSKDDPMPTRVGALTKKPRN